MKAFTLHDTRFILAVTCLLIVQVSFAQPVNDINVRYLNVSPDGNRIAVESDLGIQIYDAEFNLLTSQPSSQNVYLGDWSPDSTRIILNPTEILDVRTQLAPKALTSAYGLGGWTSDGRYVWGNAVGQPGYSFFGVDQDRVMHTVNVGDLVFEGVILTSDDQYFIGSIYHSVYVIRVQDGFVASYEMPGFVNLLASSPDGNSVAIQVMEDVEIGTPESIPTANGANLLSIYIIETQTGQIIHQLPPMPGYPIRMYFSPDGRQIIASVDSKLNVWDIATRSLIESQEIEGGIGRFAISPLGGRIIFPSGSTTASRTQSQVRAMPSLPISTYVNGAISSIALLPSPARLASIAAACNAPQSLTRALPAQATDAAVARFETALDALPTNAIPPACAADLRAVADALAAQ